MLERFTERARQVLVLAQDESALMHAHAHIGTEHLLLGLLREQDGVAARVLDSLQISLANARLKVARIVGSRDEARPGQIPFTPRARKALELAPREALILRHDYIGTEHILLVIVRHNEGVAARVLLEFDADAQKVRDATLKTLRKEH